MARTSFPLQWPDGWPRTEAFRRISPKFIARFVQDRDSVIRQLRRRAHRGMTAERAEEIACDAAGAAPVDHMMLRRVRDHRVCSALDRGGDKTTLDMLYTIERFIDGHFDGTYWGDIRVYPNADEPELLKLCEEAQGASR